MSRTTDDFKYPSGLSILAVSVDCGYPLTLLTLFLALPVVRSFAVPCQRRFERQLRIALRRNYRAHIDAELPERRPRIDRSIAERFLP